jgi:hypothetical protein
VTRLRGHLTLMADTYDGIDSLIAEVAEGTSSMIVCIHKAVSSLSSPLFLSPALLRLLSTKPPNYAYLRPTKMVRDMRGMRGKSRGLVDVCIGWRPKSVGTVHAGEALRLTAPVDMSCCKAASMRWLDMRWQQVWAKVGFWEELGEPALRPHRRQKPPPDSGRRYVARCGLCAGSAEV